jgi:adenylosuccinate synthase
MPNTLLIGAQWGDEGKGKIVDYLSRDADVVVRYQGGSNAGHTIEIGAERYVLHLVPSGILYPEKTCVIGNGLVIDPTALVSEIKDLMARGITPQGRLHVSDRAQVVLPFHKALDAAREKRSDTGTKIGTTQRGIGPAYADKASRLGLRMGDLLDSGLAATLRARTAEVNRQLVDLRAEPVDADTVVLAMTEAAEFLRPYVTDTVPLLYNAWRQGRIILFEGAQGTMLDIDFGTYPFVTSSNPTSGGACVGTGLPPQSIQRVLGVLKAYTTRVGEGPFPTELNDPTGEQLRQRGREFGATTGRPRRCGWFDAVVARYSAMVNGVDHWAITKLDVLDAFDTLRVCVAYECDGRRYETVPASIAVLQRCKPIYRDFPGWNSPTTGVTRIEDLPVRAREYVNALCDLTGVKLGILSVGPQRASTFVVGL